MQRTQVGFCVYVAGQLVTLNSFFLASNRKILTIILIRSATNKVYTTSSCVVANIPCIK